MYVCAVGTEQLSTYVHELRSGFQGSCRQYTSCFRIRSASVAHSSCSSGNSFVHSFIFIYSYIHSFIHSFYSFMPFISIHSFIHAIHLISFSPFIHSFIYSLVCLTTSPWLLPKRVIRRMRANASCLNFPLYPPFLKVIQ